MHIKFLEDGESPEIGTYKKGDEREVPDDMGNVFIQRGIAEKIKEEIKGTFPTAGLSPKTKTKIKEDDNGRQ